MSSLHNTVPAPGYRPEIDGLRAVAVVPVILFHAGFEAFRGGFVGVDVFFVISGYLITRQILTQREAGTFSLARFYGRRIRRILPALLLVSACCVPMAWLLMMPDHLRNFGQNLTATALSANNVLLFLKTSYWEPRAELNPLLHTWSLGVEEQFYLFYPLLLMLLPFGRRGVFWVIAGLACISLCAALWHSVHAPAGGFFLLHARLWELALGALCAFAGARVQHDAVAATGLAMIGLGILWGDPGAYPAQLPLLAVAGTALMIVGTPPGGLIARALSARWIVGIGLVSYSAYLWHQPLFAFWRLAHVDVPSPLVMGLLSLCVLPLAYASWRWVERPFRAPGRVPARYAMAVLGSVTGALAIIGVLFHVSLVPNRFQDRGLGDIDRAVFAAYNESVGRVAADRFPVSGRPRVLVLGNSYARDLVNAGLENGRFADVDLVYREDVPGCLERLGDDDARRALVRSADVVIFGSGSHPPGCIASDANWLAEASVQPIFVGPKHFGYNMSPFALLPPDRRAGAMGRIPAYIQERNRRMRAGAPPEAFIDLIDLLSPDGTTVPVFDDAGRLLSPDGVHLNRAGAKHVGALLFRHPLLRDF